MFHPLFSASIKLDLKKNALLFLTAVLFFKAILQFEIPTPIPFLGGLWVVLIYLFEELASRLPEKRSLLIFIELTLELILTTLLVHYMGNFDWIAPYLYLFPLVHAALSLERSLFIGILFLTVFSLGVLSLLEFSTLIPHIRFTEGWDPWKKNLFTLIMLLILLIAFSRWFLALRSDHEAKQTLLENSGTEKQTDGKLQSYNRSLEETVRQRIIELEALQKRFLFATALNRVADAIARHKDQKSLFRGLSRMVGEALDADRSIIYNVSQKGGDAAALCQWNISSGTPDPMMNGFSSQLLHRVALHLGQTRKYLESHRDDIHPLLKEDGSASLLHREMKIQDLLFYPFGCSARGHYILALHRTRRRRAWKEEELQFLEGVARQVETALQRIASLEAQKEIRTQLEETNKKLDQQNQELKSLDAMKNALLFNVSHEFRTPLSSIMGYLELLEDGELGDVRQKDAIMIVQGEATRLNRLINQLLDTAKMESAKRSLNLTPCRINPGIHQCLRVVAPLLEAKNQELAVDLEGSEEAWVMADQEKIHEILINLLGNAIKFTPEAGKIRVNSRVARPGDGSEWAENEPWLTLSVTDNGIGIPEEEQSKIFEQFYQVSKGASGGTGLGLSIVKSLVELHGGKIWVESRVNQGSTFSFTLPMVEYQPSTEKQNDN